MPSDLNDVTPTSLNHIVGQKTVVDQLLVALTACFEDHRRLDDALLVGPPGLGKCQIAAVIGHELAVKTHEALGQSVKNIGDLNALLLGAGDKEVVFIDEVHELPKVHQTALYFALDKRQDRRPGRQVLPEPSPSPISRFCWARPTNTRLLQPLRDRMRLLLRFDFYSVEELIKIVTHRAKALKWHLDETLPPLIAQRGRGTPRLALRLLQACWRVCRAEGRGEDHGRPPGQGVRPGATRRPRSWDRGAEVPPVAGGGGNPPECPRLDAGFADEDAVAPWSSRSSSGRVWSSRTTAGDGNSPPPGKTI